VTRIVTWVLIRLRLVILPGWIVVAILVATHLPAFTDQTQSETTGLVPTNARSASVEARGIRDFGTPMLSRVAVVQRDSGGLSADVQKRAVRRALRIDRHRDEALRSIAFALPVSNAGGIFPGARERGTTVVTFLYFRPGVSTDAQLALAQTYVQRIRSAGDPVVGVAGTLRAREAEFRHIQSALPIVEIATVGLIALILLFSFAAIGPPVVTLGAAFLSYVISVHVLTRIASALGVQIPREVEPVLVVLLLGLTTDYSVFFFSGARQRLSQDEPRIRAAEGTTRLFLPIIATAGLIVALGSASLAVGKFEFFRAFGPGMAVTVLVTLAVAVTLIPATLAVFGRLLFWPGSARDDAGRPRGGRALRRFLTTRPVASALAVMTAVVLVLAAAHARTTALGLNLVTGLPGSDNVKRASDAAARGFAPGILSPTELLLEGPRIGHERDRLVRLQHLVAAQPGVAAVLGIGNQPRRIHEPVAVNASGDAARFAVILENEPLETHAIHALRRLHDDLPTLLSRAGLTQVTAGLAGDTALASDTVATIHGDITRVALALLLANFLLLAVFLRALLAPLYLLAASVLALTASIGIATWVFQGIMGYNDLTYYVPFAAAVLLLSLGSDYNIFIVGRIWQEAERRSLREAIQYATPRAARAITIAGMALAGSFALLALIPIRAMRELAFTISVGVLIDSFIVRTVLVPSLIAAFGHVSWWPRRFPEPAPES